MGGPYCRKPMETMFFFPMKSRRGYSRISLKQITWILLLDSPKQLTGHKPLTGTVSMQCIQPQFSVSIWNLQNLGRIFAGLKVLTLKNCRRIMIIWYNVSSTPTKHQSISLYTWWLIPLSKWVITPVTNGISRVNPLITGVITHLLSGMSHQVHGKRYVLRTKLPLNFECARRTHCLNLELPVNCAGATAL